MTEVERLQAMSNWEIEFAKDAVCHAKRLVHLAKLAKRGYACPPYADEAAAIAESLQRNGERVAKWLKALYAAIEAQEAKEQLSKEPTQQPSGTACEAEQVRQ